MKTALIFGVDGQDGSYLTELLLSKGYSIIGWVPANINLKINNIRHLLNRITLIEGKLEDQVGLIHLLEDTKPDEIYNFASPSFPSASWSSTVAVGNIAGLGVARILDSIVKVSPRTKFYQASTSELFGNPIEEPQNENTPFRPRNPYGVAKLYGHWITVNYREKYGIHAVSGILYNHESPRRGEEFVSRKITLGVAKIKMGLMQELQLGDLDARRDWGYAGDYVDAIWRMIQSDHPTDYVIGTGETHSVRDICEIAFAYVGLDYEKFVRVNPDFVRPPEKIQLVADNSKAKRDLGWYPKTSFEELIKMMVESDLERLQENIERSSYVSKK